MPEQVRHDEKQMPDLSRILSAKQPLTLSGTPAGFLPWLLADLARAADKRAIFIAADEVDMRAVAATAAWFAPELDVRSEEHTSELQSLMRNSYAVFCLKKKKHELTAQVRSSHTTSIT